MRKLFILLMALVLTLGIATAQSNKNTAEEEKISPGLTPSSPFYGVEMFAENLEVKLAGVIGGSDMKAKAMANNAEERLSEARELVERNKSDEAADLVERYSQTMNKSIEMAGRGNDNSLKQKIDNISSRNIETLKDVQEKVPSSAQEAIQRAIDQSEKRAQAARNRTGRPEEIPGKNTSVRPEKPGTDKAQNMTGKPGAKNISEKAGINRSTDPARQPENSSLDRVSGNTTQEAENTISNSTDNGSSENLDDTQLNKSSDNSSLDGLR